MLRSAMLAPTSSSAQPAAWAKKSPDVFGGRRWLQQLQNGLLAVGNQVAEVVEAW
jgi:hypothetical protein